MKVKTRDRILETSLRLFNDIGEPNVTTLLISEEMSISPGNLYYHFKSKGDIVTELFGHYQGEMDDLLDVPEDAVISLEQVALFTHLTFEAIARYRFLYQDLVNVLSRHTALQKRFTGIMDQKIRAFRTIIDSLRAQGVMTTDDQTRDALCQQMGLTLCYWVSYEMLSHLNTRNRIDLGQGVFQVLTLLTPYLTEDGQLQVRLLADDYL
ncbi:TetR family transcriptional regulator [Tamilnaduibacter salinus]|uniref:TetR family transcriptional regulator n=1 Tax=Tamilnaduibacter salinus TaxID=1484056 RepID=A0A2A2HZU1_9GAMM|nr:TetR/AcrR family transcriptional regulator [Tamilnaduibacter salinus]PAV24668.1 TetR family transcriptional regulator [Tamilnaduibacter salinus]PVY78061.1 TetR family transcriptional regulator [Tamilnaduibacter salinus]